MSLRLRRLLLTIQRVTGEEQQEQGDQQKQGDLLDDLLSPIPRTAIVPAVRAALGLSQRQTDRIVQTFDDFVARPLVSNLMKLHGRDLAKRNPMIYTVRGVETVEEWADQVLADKETSAIEAHIGTWLEEVARLVSGGIKPAAASTPDHRRRRCRAALRDPVRPEHEERWWPQERYRGAPKGRPRPTRPRQRVELNIAVLSGRAKTGVMRANSESPC